MRRNHKTAFHIGILAFIAASGLTEGFTLLDAGFFVLSLAIEIGL